VTDLDELAQTLVAIGDALEALSVRWAIGGSLASSAYGEPRATNDIDIVAELDEDTARRLAVSLAGHAYADADMAADAVRRGSSFNVIDERTFIKVDIFVPRPGRLGRGQLDRRQHLELLPDITVPVLGPEDVVLQKLRWFDMGGRASDRQWRDIVSVLRGRQLDDAYLEAVASEAGLDELLGSARADART
jgi:Nucleotidyl transferase AbiEii toxin, Type IV TA system